MAQNFHVPKFGNWDSDNVPYTEYFEHARREKVGMMMNPNDPMENPEALRRVGKNVDGDEVHGYSHIDSSSEKRSHHGLLENHAPRRHVRNRFRRSQGRVTTEFTSEQSNSVTHRSTMSDHKRDMTKGASSIKSSSFNDHARHQATAIPKFGSWDVTNPNSGEGYTAIFNKIKEEKHIKYSNVSSISSTAPLKNCSNIKNRYCGPSFKSKYCCCLFPGQSK